ncbi:MAG: hypothetical protein ACYS0H_14960 [Planctomycetota bacterium]|jgi:hypothetical protein
MKPADRLKRLIKARRYEADAETYDKALGSFLQAVDDQIKQKAALNGPSLWRRTIESRMTKLAAAALIIVAAYTVIRLSGGSVDVATVSLAEITENMKQMPWLHVVMEATGGMEPADGGYGGGYEMWFCFEQRTMMTKLANGQIRCADFLKHIVQDYDPSTDTITVTLDDGADTIIGRTAMDFPETLLKFFDDAKEKVIQQETGKYRGQKARIIKLSGIWGDSDIEIELVVDSKKDVLLFASNKCFTKAGQLVIEAKGYFDYPETGPESIYDVGVSRSAKIVRGEQEGERTAYDKAFGEAISVVDERGNWPGPRELAIAYWQARAAKNYDEMAILWPGSATWNQSLDKEEPVDYVFGEAKQWEIEGNVIVPYASKSYHEKHGKYSLKMVLSNKKSARGRYYIVSGN